MMTIGWRGDGVATDTGGTLTGTLATAAAWVYSLISSISKSALPTWHSGHIQSSGTSSQRVPAAMPS
ncbi:hypothetical protein D3C80_1699080 [compost metagenome]